MKKLKQSFSLAILFWGATNLSLVSLAQFISPYVPRPEQIRPDLYKKQNNGTILETKTGDIYDRKGNVLRRAPNPSDTYNPTGQYVSYEQQKFCLSLLEKEFSSVWAQAYQQSGCKDRREPRYFSIRGDQPVSIKFFNQRNRRINIYWIDYQGISKFYKSLEPGEQYIQQTYMTHPWLVTDDKNRTIAVLLPEREFDTADIR
jgi:hypothetical protein